MRPGPRAAMRLTGALAVIGAPVAAGATWAAARVLTSAPSPRLGRPTLDLRVLDDRWLEVRGDRADDPGSWGLLLETGFVRIHDATRATGPVTVAADPWVRRPYTLLDGAMPRPPWPVRATITPFAWPDDPQVLARHTGATLRLDGVRSDGHTLPVWILEPRGRRSTTWVVGVHGRGSPRTELFRIAAIALRRGHPVLVASYRTDAWTAAPRPVTTLGTVEWRDAEANLAAALAHGATDVVLAGCSLGGGLAAQVVRRSTLSPWISGVVLDSPALAWHELLRELARRNGLPTGLVRPVMAAARLRAAVDWSMLDHVSAVDEFRQPVLLVHGGQDDVVPVLISEAFAAARPELVTFVRVEDATHVTSWNHAPLRYERSVGRFLDRVGSRP